MISRFTYSYIYLVHNLYFIVLINCINFTNVLEKVAAKGCQKHRIDKAVGILLPFIEGYCITHSSLGVSAEELSEQLATLLYQSLN